MVCVGDQMLGERSREAGGVRLPCYQVDQAGRQAGKNTRYAVRQHVDYLPTW